MELGWGRRGRERKEDGRGDGTGDMEHRHNLGA